MTSNIRGSITSVHHTVTLDGSETTITLAGLCDHLRCNDLVEISLGETAQWVSPTRWVAFKWRVGEWLIRMGKKLKL